MTQKQLKAVFKEKCGQVEKVWLRSICTNNQEGASKKPERAKIITQEYGMFKDNKNGYVLFPTVEQAKQALELNQSVVGERHIRVDSLVHTNAKGVEQDRHEDDFKTTLFVGNLPYVVSEEEVREHFAKYGSIKNVRLVREQKTFIGKGIGFIQFSTDEELRNAIEEAGKFKGRELRLKKATDPKKREKKQNRKEAAREERREKRRQKQ